MARTIKKITKRALVSSFVFGAFVITLLVRLFMGNHSHSINLSKLGSEVKELTNDANMISSARADSPGSCVGGCTSCGCTCPGCSSGSDDDDDDDS
jgi:hypothetical protein